MIIYILLVLIILSLISQNNKIGIYIGIFVLMLIISSFRDYEVGTDTANYLTNYETIVDNPMIGFIIVEPGWVIINLLANYIFNDYSGVLFISQFITLLFIFTRLWHSSTNPILGVLFYILLYYYLHSFNIARQAISLSIIFYSYPFLINREKKYYFYLLLACCFHYSALICFLFPIVVKFKITPSFWIIVLVVTFIAGIVIGKNFIHFLPAAGKYEFYLTNQVQESSFSLTRLLLNFLFLFLCINIRTTPCLTLCLFGIVIYNLMNFSPSIGRLANYFMIFQILLFTNLNKNSTNKLSSLQILLITYGIVNFLVLLNANVGGVVPYKIIYN